LVGFGLLPPLLLLLAALEIRAQSGGGALAAQFGIAFPLLTRSVWLFRHCLFLDPTRVEWWEIRDSASSVANALARPNSLWHEVPLLAPADWRDREISGYADVAQG
jgi:hypothetical protein